MAGNTLRRQLLMPAALARGGYRVLRLAAALVERDIGAALSPVRAALGP